ncbi:lipopolysaccharide heptosyltransferase I [Thiomicrorhabdus sediminis]|uniref:Lipopolysaccharide heptosyltransferase 1 n=1 Tax=Thiomicrorhabdus sediminis TaxID=2580412 RepID=A0A4P9K6J3_9GAMM|nr:lipopolysaccharide heptosyltransferase I [Thiomicrorhabdus sediminis]QCU90704.1 lipopolysaccharide heptosyltransferase I [Thiomicrorhabdus sediminis]
MRVLLIKMSSMGDVFHTFPALSDAQAAIPDLTVDWVVERSFMEIPCWHPVVDKVYPIELRKWRTSPFSKQTRSEIKSFFESINAENYDLVLDAQGLLKSIWVARKIKAPVAGMDWLSVREPLASLFYQEKVSVAKEQHAIWRLRELFAKALGYEITPAQPIVYGLDTENWQKPSVLVQNFADNPYMVFLHGTTWTTKYWPEEYWIKLLQRVNQQGFKVVLPWGNDEEFYRAQRIAANAVEPKDVWVPEQMLSLNDMAKTLKFSQSVVSVDTGLSHVAAALDVPMTVLYRVTDPKLIGADGQNVTRLVSPVSSFYVKKFASRQQEQESLQGLTVDDVLSSMAVCLGNV